MTRRARRQLRSGELIDEALKSTTQAHIEALGPSSASPLPCQDFPRRLILDDRFTEANSELALAQPGHKRPVGFALKLSFERLLS
ncbi:MAG: hypothetical protein JSR64_17135 [Nitrospira sp.]|nr:hypothetical protein [Nitrospira sp.]